MVLEKLVFLDEAGFQRGMTRLYARAWRGARAVGSVLRNRGVNLTLLAAMTVMGLQAAMLIEGGTDKLVFLAFVEAVLIPSLRPGQIVVLDNLGAHHAKGVRERIEAVGCFVLYLPPYSPDLNPIEMLFSKVKQLVRGMGTESVEELSEAIAVALQGVTPGECRGWCGAAGYRVPSN